MSSHSAIYATFDRFPAPKGASTHIRAFATALTEMFPNVDLVTVAGPTEKTAAQATVPNGLKHTELPAFGQSLIERVMHFRSQLKCWWGNRHPQVAHVRSIFEGYPIATHKRQSCERFVFEVNGLPSIELKYHYPRVADDRELMKKLLAQEQRCLEAADMIVTVSEVGAEFLRGRGVEPARLRVIPNGVDVDLFPYKVPRSWEPAAKSSAVFQLLYSGTLSSWQGVHTAIEALALVRSELPARLTIVGYGRAGQSRHLLEWAQRCGVLDYVRVLDTVSQSELAQLHHQADAVLVPLTPNDRNLVQGCCPLKVLEAMASGTPVVASDMPVVAALARRDIDAILVRPGSAKSLQEGILQVINDPVSTRRRSENARRRVETDFTWKVAQARLIEAYQPLL